MNVGTVGLRTVRRAKVPVTYHTYELAGMTVIHTKCWTCSWLWIFAFSFWIFLPLVDHVMLTWEKIPDSPHFSILQATKSWAGPGNEATIPGKINLWLSQVSRLNQPLLIQGVLQRHATVVGTPEGSMHPLKLQYSTCDSKWPTTFCGALPSNDLCGRIKGTGCTISRECITHYLRE